LLKGGLKKGLGRAPLPLRWAGCSLVIPPLRTYFGYVLLEESLPPTVEFEGYNAGIFE
jgi:hypothetical protein